MTGIVGRTHLDHDAFPFVWMWRSRTWQLPDITFKAPWFGDGVDRKGMRCRVLTRGGMNSALVEFADGYRVVTSRGGLRKANPVAPAVPAVSRRARGDTRPPESG